MRCTRAFQDNTAKCLVSFVQVRVEAQTLHRNALASLHHGIKKKDLRIDFITLALHGKKVVFGKVIKTIDAMVKTLKEK